VDEKDRFFSFERALRELKLKEDELKRLVSEGEIRAFRDEDKMKFRKEDIDRLRKKAEKPDFSKGPSDASADTLADDLVFEEEELNLGEEEPGMQTAPISEDTLLDDDIGMTTEPLSKGSGKRQAAASGKKSAPPTSSRGTRIREAQSADEKGSPLMTAVVVLSSIVLFLGVFVAVDLFKDQKGGLTEGIVNFFGENFSSP
jgi:hypothetical protein